MALNDTRQEIIPWDSLKEEMRAELDQYRRELKEIDLMLEQSQLEVKKLAQRNASINFHLQQMHAQFESLPRSDIRTTYDSALDVQQRLFMMKGQVEKLQNDQARLSRYLELLERLLLALENDLPEEGHSKSAMTETVEMMIQAQEAERQRLSRQMHDGPAQALSNFILQTEIAMRLFDIDQVKARDELSLLKVSATSTFQKVRDFIFELRPMMLDDLGLTPTIKRYLDAFKEQSALDIRLSITGMERRLESYQEVMIFRAIQELLNNAIRHSQASQVKVQLDMGNSDVKVMVSDNGKGFNVESLQERGSMGLKVIRERAEMLGGFMQVDSVIGQGTRVTFQIPAVTPALEK